MTAWRQAIELSIGDEDVARLVTITRARTEPASRVERVRMLLAYREDPSFFAVAHALGVHHQTVQRCVEAITSVFPQTVVQTCIVHLIRNSLAFVSWKDRKAILPAIKAIYRAENADMAMVRLEGFGGE